MALVVAAALAAALLASATVAQPARATAAPAIVDCYGLPATIVGTADDDRLVGTEGPDVIVGLGGKDRIRGLAGDDVICGGAKADRIEDGDGNDVVLGQGDSGGGSEGEGKGDRFVASPGDDLVFGGEDGRYDSMDFGLATAPMVLDGPSSRVTSDGLGTDTLHDIEQFYGSPNDDVFECKGFQTCFAWAGSGDDVIRHSRSRVDGGDGDDTILVRGGQYLDGGPGNDHIRMRFEAYFWSAITGGDGDDTIISGTEDGGRIDGGAGNDLIRLRAEGQADGESGDDRLIGSAQLDALDDLVGGLGNDFIDGRGGEDFGDGGEGTDTCRNVEHPVSCER